MKRTDSPQNRTYSIETKFTYRNFVYLHGTISYQGRKEAYPIPTLKKLVNDLKKIPKLYVISKYIVDIKCRNRAIRQLEKAVVTV